MNTSTTTHAPAAITAAQVLHALAHCADLCARFAGQRTARAIQYATHTVRGAWRWLNARHDFGNEEGEIIWSGWQYVGACAVVLAACVLLSIQW